MVKDSLVSHWGKKQSCLDQKLLRFICLFLAKTATVMGYVKVSLLF